MTSPTIEMHSSEISSLLEALAKAQSTMRGAVEDSSNPFFKSSYADLTSVWEACREPLTKNGLSIIQTIQVLNGTTCLVSILGHQSGQWIKSILPIKPAREDIQSFGSAMTYCRRYALSALVGVCPVDDDGEAAMDHRHKKKDKSEDEAQIALNVPAGVDEKKLDFFIQESANTSKCSINDVKRRAAKNMNGFLKAFHEWNEKTNPDSQEIAI